MQRISEIQTIKLVKLEFSYINRAYKTIQYENTPDYAAREGASDWMLSQRLSWIKWIKNDLALVSRVFTEYNGAGPSCSDDSLPGSFPPRNRDMSSAVERFKQLPIFVCVSACVYVCMWMERKILFSLGTRVCVRRPCERLFLFLLFSVCVCLDLGVCMCEWYRFCSLSVRVVFIVEIT